MNVVIEKKHESFHASKYGLKIWRMREIMSIDLL